MQMLLTIADSLSGAVVDRILNRAQRSELNLVSGRQLRSFEQDTTLTFLMLAPKSDWLISYYL